MKAVRRFLHGCVRLLPHFATVSLRVGSFGIRRKNPTFFAATLLFAGFTFVKWKHGFVRADGHCPTFSITTQPSPLSAGFFMLITSAVNRTPARGACYCSCVDALVGLWASLWMENSKMTLGRLQWVRHALIDDHLKTNISQLLHPVRAKAELDRQLAIQRATHVMPLTKEAVGTHSIDLFRIPTRNHSVK